MTNRKKNKEIVTRLILGVIGLALAVWLVVEFRSTGRANANTHAIQQGQTTYEQFCAGCHESSSLQLATPPPKLDGLFQRAKLPSGEPVTDDAVRNVILNGRGIMPPFKDAIGGDDLTDLMLYLHTK